MPRSTRHAVAEFVGGGVAFLAVLGAGAGIAEVLKSDDPAPKPATTRTVRCTEDGPCWRCDSMGNRVCGSDAGTLYIHPTGRIERR